MIKILDWSYSCGIIFLLLIGDFLTEIGNQRGSLRSFGVCSYYFSLLTAIGIDRTDPNSFRGFENRRVSENFLWIGLQNTVRDFLSPDFLCLCFRSGFDGFEIYLYYLIVRDTELTPYRYDVGGAREFSGWLCTRIRSDP